MRKVVIVIAVLIVLGALGGGFYLIGPPAEERARRLDGRRESDLQRLRLAADLYWTRNSRLPATLDELAKEAGTNVFSRDPETGAPYEYMVKVAEGRAAARGVGAPQAEPPERGEGPPRLSNDAYELCATFRRESEARGDFWSHGAGRHCFEIRAKEIRP